MTPNRRRGETRRLGGVIAGALGRATLILILASGLDPAAAAPAAYPAPSRPVAPVVSPSWGDPAQRDRDQEVPQIAARLSVRPGMTVADIGAGSGYDTVRLAALLGAKGRVVAEDVTPAYVERLRRSISEAGVRNVDVILGSPGDPHLTPRSIDRAIMVHMYHEIGEPYALLARLARAFKAHGLLGIEELDRPTERHGTPPALLRCELAASGYRLVGLSPLKGSLGYFAVFSPPKSSWRRAGAPCAAFSDAAATLSSPERR